MASRVHDYGSLSDYLHKPSKSDPTICRNHLNCNPTIYIRTPYWTAVIFINPLRSSVISAVASPLPISPSHRASAMAVLALHIEQWRSITDENGRKRSAKASITFTFTIFYRKRKRYDIIRNENDIGITVISKTKIYDREHIDNGRNSLKRYFEKR